MAGWVAGSAVEAMEVAVVVGSAAVAPVEDAAVRQAAGVRAEGSAEAPEETAGWVAMAEAEAGWATPAAAAPPSAAYTNQRFA